VKKAPDPFSSKAAYFLALRWLSARDLSEGQVRERLARRGYTAAAAIDPAIERLTRDRTLDDRRAAAAVARAEAKIRRRGPRRIMGRLVAMHIDRDLAKEVVHELFGETDEAELLEQTLDKRLRGNTARLRDPHERRKLVAYLIRQGFSASAASALIRKRSREQ
jgi:regulatory protein